MLDTSIPLQYRPSVQLDNPMDVQQKTLTLKHLMMQGQMQDMQLAQAQEEQRQQRTLADIYRGAGMGQDGQPNHGAIVQGMVARGLGKLVPGYLKQVADAQKAQADVGHVNAQTAGLTQDQQIKAHTQSLQELGAVNSPDSMQQWLMKGVRAGGLDYAKAAGLTNQMMSDPSTWQDIKLRMMKTGQAINDQITALTPKLQVVNLGGTEVLVDMNTNTRGSAPTSFQRTQTPDSVASNARIAADNAASRAQAERHFQADYGLKTAIADPFGALGINKNAPKPQAGATNASVAPSGDAFLSSVPKPMADQVKALAEGRMAFPSGFALKSPYWQSMLQAVAQYDPNFDAVNYNSRSQTRKDFTSGKSATSLNALNTVLGHLDDLSKASDALGNTSYPLLNTGLNWVATNAGRPEVNKFNAAKQAVVSELERAYRGGVGSEGDIKRWSESINSSSSPEQLKGVINELTVLLGSKISAMGDQYSKGMGKTSDGLELLTPRAQAAYSRLASGGSKDSGGARPPLSAFERGK